MHDTILTFPMGYETVLGETGHALTGGQKQKLALARALYGTPKYIVMDEPSAAMDDASEKALIILIKALKNNGSTVIFTTHRPNLITAADNLLVLANGKQVGYGTVASMLNKVKADALIADAKTQAATNTVPATQSLATASP